MPTLIRIACLLLVLARPSPLFAQPGLADGAAESGFIALDEITPANVGQLAVAFTFKTGAPGAHATAPLPAGNTLLVLTPFPHTLFALDLTKPGAPVKWAYTPPANGTAKGLTCCGAPTGGVAVDGDRIYLSTLDGHVVALAGATGQVIWDVPVADPEAGEILPTAALPIRDTLIVGTSGDDFGARGALIGLETATGKQRWKVLQHRPRQRGWHRGRLSTLLPDRSRQRSRHHDLASLDMAAGRRGLGRAGGVRCRIRSAVSGDRPSRALEPRPARGRESVDIGPVRPRSADRRRPLVRSRQPARPLRVGRRRADCCWRTARAGPSWPTPTPTDFSTCWTARPERSFRRGPICPSRPRMASTWQPAA